MFSIISAEELHILNIILIFTVNTLFVVVSFDLILEVDVHVLALLHFRTPLLLLMIYHEKTRLNANPNPKGVYESAIAPISSVNEQGSLPSRHGASTHVFSFVFISQCTMGVFIVRLNWDFWKYGFWSRNRSAYFVDKVLQNGD